MVTLAMACVLTVGWMRSSLVEDVLVIPQRESHLTIVSVQGQLGSLIMAEGYFEKGLKWISADVAKFGGEDVFDAVLGIDTARPQWTWLGFRVGAGRTFGFVGGVEDRFEFWIVPYWSLVLPLTLLSAWLILGKIRKAKPGSDFGFPARDESSQ